MASSAMVIAATIGTATAAGNAAAAGGDGKTHRYIVTAASSDAYAKALSQARHDGAKVIMQMRQIGSFVIVARQAVSSSLASTDVRVGLDGIKTLTQTDRSLAKPSGVQRHLIKNIPNGSNATDSVQADPGFGYKGLQWDFRRIGAQKEWRSNMGDSAVVVGVADTGLDFTHKDLKSRVIGVVDFTEFEDPPICDPIDRDLAKEFGGPVKTDWNGHGSWIGGNIAAALNGTGINGIAPKVMLFSLKISNWCGSAYDSELLDAYLFAADHGIDIVSNSFGGYTDRSDPDQELIYQNYIAAVKYARANGTVIVVSAGNEHMRIGAGGKVLSHGPLTAPGGAFFDLFGYYQTPGGIPGIVDVAATGNVVNPSRAHCPPGSEGDPSHTNATCKRDTDAHQAAGQGLQDQLSYYSNYGPRIDVSAPGGARKFNLPVWDRGGTPGFPVTQDDLTQVWEDFSVTSNWAQSIPCYTFQGGSGFPPGQCYTSIQGTSMATPHASAVLALIASAHPEMRHDVDALVAALEAGAVMGHNTTPPILVGDTSDGDLSEVACDSGYCHLGGDAIPDDEAYGAGIVQATSAG